MARVQLKNVRKVYPNGYEAVKDFTLDIPDGEFVVLVGPSGCGKSTTLRMVAGLEDASGGMIDIGGRVVNDVHPKDRDIAMVFQNYALYPHMSVYKNMAFALKLRKVPKDQIDQRVRQAARMLGIEELLDRKPRALSGGQRQRVAVGRAIVREPKAFLFDEPLSNLDAKLRVTTRAELKQLHQRLKTTTIYVTHDQEEAMTLGDRIVVMSKGLIQQEGSPLEVYRRPVNRFVASFVGTPPMNFIEGVLQQDGQGIRFVENGGLSLPVAEEHVSALRGHAGKQVALGVRPQAIVDVAGHAHNAHASGREAGITLPVRVVEPLGDTMDVFTATPNGTPLVARVHARQGVVPGSSFGVSFKMDECHYFEPGEFGRSLLNA